MSNLLQYKGKPSQDQLRRWCLEVPCSVNLNLLNLCQIVKEERFQERDTNEKKQFKIFSRFLRKVAVPLYKRNKSKFDILPVNANNFRKDMFIEIYNFELLPSLTNYEPNSRNVVDVLDESSEAELSQYLNESSDDLINCSQGILCESSELFPQPAQGICEPLPDLLNHDDKNQKSASRRALNGTGGGDQLNNSSTPIDMCSSSDMFPPPVDVGISQPLPAYTQVMCDDNLVTSTQI